MRTNANHQQQQFHNKDTPVLSYFCTCCQTVHMHRSVQAEAAHLHVFDEQAAYNEAKNEWSRAIALCLVQ